MVSSCNKNDNANAGLFPLTLNVTAINQTSGIRMFTNGTEITDTSAIHRFIGNSPWFNPHGIFESHPFITFEYNDTAVFSGVTTNFSVTKTADLFLFYSKTMCVEIDPLNRISVLLDTSLKYKYPKMAIPSGTNLTKFITREVRVGHGDYPAMVLSAFSYKISTYGGAGSS
jgi:hypothetical protein